MNKETLRQWIIKISKMDSSDLYKFEHKTLALSTVDTKAKKFLQSAVDLRKDSINVVSPIAVSDYCKGELS